MKHIMIVDDDIHINQMLEEVLTSAGYKVTHAYSGTEALLLLPSTKPDLILLDLMMPELSGIEVTEILRKKQNFTPILILTARDDEEMKLTGLNSGSDEYLDKATPMKEIIVRVNALIRRHQHYNKTIENEKSAEKSGIKFDRLELDFTKKVCIFDRQPLELTKREFEILELLIERSGDVISREELLQHFWGISSAAETRTIDVLISKIRKKLDNQFIKTKRGFGYYFSDEKD